MYQMETMSWHYTLLHRCCISHWNERDVMRYWILKMNRPSYGQGPTTSKGNISEGTMQGYLWFGWCSLKSFVYMSQICSRFKAPLGLEHIKMSENVHSFSLCARFRFQFWHSSQCSISWCSPFSLLSHRVDDEKWLLAARSSISEIMIFTCFNLFWT